MMHVARVCLGRYDGGGDGRAERGGVANEDAVRSRAVGVAAAQDG